MKCTFLKTKYINVITTYFLFALQPKNISHSAIIVILHRNTATILIPKDNKRHQY